VRALVVAPDGSWLASAGSGDVLIWDPAVDFARRHIDLMAELSALEVAADGYWLISSGDGKKIRTYPPNYADQISTLAAAPDGSWLNAA
jgi:hypothetical protein